MLTSGGEERHAAAAPVLGPVPATRWRLSVSLDELALGYGLGLFQRRWCAVLVAIAAQAFCVSQVGLRLGARLNERLRQTAARVAGVRLIAVAAGVAVGQVVG